MNKQNLIPKAAQPVNRITTGQLPAQLAELSEEVLQLHDDTSASVLASLEMANTPDCVSCGTCCNFCSCVSGCPACNACGRCCDCGGCCRCSYDGDDAE